MLAIHLMEALVEQGFSVERWGDRVTATRLDPHESISLHARSCGESWFVQATGRGRSMSTMVRWSHELRDILVGTFPQAEPAPRHLSAYHPRLGVVV